MFKAIRKILPLLLCLLLMACLLPAAYANTEIGGNTLQELKDAISAYNQDSTEKVDFYTSGSFTITEDVTIPDGFRLRVINNDVLTIAADAVVTVNGKLDVKEDGYIDILGKVVNYGQVRMFDAGVIHAGGTLENRSWICYEDVSPDVKHLVVDKKENLQIWGPLAVYDGVSPTESVLGVPVDNWCITIPKDEPEVSLYMILVGVRPEDNSSSGRYSYIEIRGTEAYTLTKDMTVPAGTEVVMNNIVLTVPTGMTLTVNGELTVKNLVVEDGGNVITGDGGSITYTAEKTEVEANTLAELKSALADNVAKIYVYQNITLDGNLTIPENSYVKVRNSGTLTVPTGKTLTINGKIEASFDGLIRVESGGTLENNGEIEMYDGGVIAVTGTFKNNGRGVTFQLENPNAPTPQLIIDETAYVAGGGLAFYAPINPADAVPNINLGNYCHHIDYKKPNQTVYYPGNVMTFELMFPEGGQYIDYLEVHGLNTLTLSANVEIPVFDDGTASRVDMSETTLVVPSGMKLTVNGELIVKDLVVEDGGTVIKGPNGSITYAAGSDIEALRDAIANPEISQFELSGNPFTITEALTIPSDFTVIVGSGSSLEIPAGVALNLKGRLILREGAVLNVLQTSSANRGRIIGGTLEVDTGSTVNLMGRLEIDILRLDGTLTTQNSGVWYEFELTDLDNGRPRGRMIISNGGSHSVSSNGLDEAKLQDWVSFEGDQASLEISYRAKSDQDLSEMTQRIRNLPARFQGSVRLRYGAVIRDDYIFPGIQIRVDGSSGGSLTIAEGAVLTAPTVYLKGAELTVNGTFISIPRDNNNHSGAVILQGNTSRLTVSDTGIIGGTDCTIEIGTEITDPDACLDGVKFSQLQDISDPHRVAAGFRTYRFIPELSLPAALNTIESEAFAGGSFSSVYIPAGVTSIAPDAFGDRTDLKVYGEYNTEAETFAAGKGFPFAPSTWS